MLLATEDADRHRRLHERGVGLLPLSVAQEHGLSTQLLGLLEQVDEDADLAANDVRFEGLGQVVRAPVRVGLLDLVARAVVCSDEDDRCRVRALVPLDLERGLEAVHDRHADVEEDGGKVVEVEARDRFGARRGRYDAQAQRLEDGLQRELVWTMVVDDQHARDDVRLDALVARGQGPKLHI